MRILDENDIELFDPDYSTGYTEEEIIVIAHHNAIEAVEEQWHYEVVQEYPNGGKDVKRVVDVPGVEAHDAWDETENILRWHPYPEDQLPLNPEQIDNPEPTIDDILDVLLGVLP